MHNSPIFYHYRALYFFNFLFEATKHVFYRVQDMYQLGIICIEKIKEHNHNSRIHDIYLLSSVHNDLFKGRVQLSIPLN
jgi:hypothetical protein